MVVYIHTLYIIFTTAIVIRKSLAWWCKPHPIYHCHGDKEVPGVVVYSHTLFTTAIAIRKSLAWWCKPHPIYYIYHCYSDKEVPGMTIYRGESFQEDMSIRCYPDRSGDMITLQGKRFAVILSSIAVLRGNRISTLTSPPVSPACPFKGV